MKTISSRHSYSLPLLSVIAAIAGLCLPGRAFALVGFETIPIGTLAEGLAISNQYTLSDGITFNLAGGIKPILAQVGSPGYAFTGFGGVDDLPAPGQNVGDFFLVGPSTHLQSGVPLDLLVAYSTPSQFASGVILDIDGNEGWLVQALNSSAVPIDSLSLNPGSPGAGDALATTWSFSHAGADIAGIRIHYNGTQTANIGYAWDNFSTVPVPEPGAATIILIGGLMAWRRRLATGKE